MHRLQKLSTFVVFLLGLLLAGDASSRQYVYAYALTLRPPVILNRQGKEQPIPGGWVLHERDQFSVHQDGRIAIYTANGTFIRAASNTKFRLQKLDNHLMILQMQQGLLHLNKSNTWGGRARVLWNQYELVLIQAEVFIETSDSGWRVIVVDGKVTIYGPKNSKEVVRSPAFSYVAKSNDDSEIQTVGTDEVNRYRQRVTIKEGSGVMTADGGWWINLASYRKLNNANRLIQKLHYTGIPVSRQTVTVKGKRFHRVVLGQFDTWQDANHWQQRLERHYRLSSPWLSCRTGGRACKGKR